MRSTLQGTKPREETPAWFTGCPQNVPVVVTGVGWRWGSMCLAIHGSVAGAERLDQKPRGVIKEQSGQTGESLKPGES